MNAHSVNYKVFGNIFLNMDLLIKNSAMLVLRVLTTADLILLNGRIRSVTNSGTFLQADILCVQSLC